MTAHLCDRNKSANGKAMLLAGTLYILLYMIIIRVLCLWGGFMCICSYVDKLNSRSVIICLCCTGFGRIC